MKLQDILPKISVNDNWGKDYRRYVPKFIAYAKERTHVNEWKSDVRDQLFRSVNCISSLRQGNFYLNERDYSRTLGRTYSTIRYHCRQP